MEPDEWVRVRVIETGAHITIPRVIFDKKDHVELKQDPLDRNGEPRAATPRKPAEPADPETAPEPGGEADPADQSDKADEEAK